tara:strand:+ start:10852 stop:11133 length:282 start_codon:yes stop_codon:yes gene_type:complete
MKSDADKLLKKNEQLNHLEMVKVVSHVQRPVEAGAWISNSLMLESYDVPFKYKRKQKYRSLQGARVNVTYYPEVEKVAGFDIEVMKVVRIRQS